MNLDSAADFCPQCHFMLELPEVMDIIECNRCGYKCSITDYQPKYIISTIKMEPKSWLSNQPQESKLSDQSHRAVIEQVCPKCSHEEAYFSTAQLRSADEGSTVFYECVKCQFRYQLNN
ncbi:unnamed protein product (macronuclear) [Paramecium tetraurelia]|uniref:DNA-directed RNA polymerase subunit n=1 Tax=Paramecium tetraurelia TaxID=5888 RepID=A0E7M3_PARTE|nr:uncharacterized protein GSPATT00024018001 [Paramecium tetraurelia]CAK91290.1 unnamed protein product [Paramecium tetraurelia]|eukprot:XP_001458687.1 hypothetical protein (macronuclear) [Paramecium tetraurelia strain d4-2]